MRETLCTTYRATLVGRLGHRTRTRSERRRGAGRDEHVALGREERARRDTRAFRSAELDDRAHARAGLAALDLDYEVRDVRDERRRRLFGGATREAGEQGEDRA